MARQVASVGFMNTKNTLFLLCDVQEKFRTGMTRFEPMLKNTVKLLEAGKILRIPLIATEQYPEKLGPTVVELNVKHASGLYGKAQFSMMTPEVNAKIKELYGADGLHSVVLFGIETHICVEQTSMDLRAIGLDVHVVADCSISRSDEDRVLAFERLRQMGCFVTSSESLIFKLLKTKDHPDFNEVRKWLGIASVDTGLAKL